MTRYRLVVPAVAVALALVGCSPGDAEQATRRSGDRIDVGDRRGPVFDADAAFALLERQVAFGPRVPGTAGHAAQRDWMLSYLSERADTLWPQEFRHVGPEGEVLELTNVVARFNTGSRDRVLLVAHWDTRPTADNEPDDARRGQPIPGANDGASGTAVLLQLADVLSSHSPPIGVDLLLVDGEDYAPDHMYLGATHFATTLEPGYDPLYGVLVDMVADLDPRYLQEGHSRRYAPEVVDRVWRMAERLGYQRYFPASHTISIGDDHVPLNDAGIRTAVIIDFDYDAWHTLDDDLHNVGPEGLGVVGTVLLELIFRGG